MERYQAILEQLKKAQSRGLETFTNRIDFVVQSLEELIQEAKSSVQGALPQSADECFPVDEIEEALTAFRDQVEADQQYASELESRVAELDRALEARSEGTSIGLLRTLDGAQSQSELLRELLPVLSEHAARAVVLVLREGTVSAWSGIGFADGERLHAWKGDTDESPTIATLMDVVAPIKFAPGNDQLFRAWLTDEQPPGEALLTPIVLRGKLMGAIYTDHLDDQPWNPDTTQALVALTCWLIDTLPYRQEPAPMLADPHELETPPDAVTEEPEPEPIPEAEPEPEPEMELSPVLEPEPEPEAETDAEVEHEIDDPSATVRVDVSDFEAAAEPPEADEPPSEPDGKGGPAELSGEAFEPDEPAQPEFESEAQPDTEFELVETPPEHVAPADEFEPVEEPPVEVEAAEPIAVPTEVQMPAVDEEEAEEEAESRFLEEPPPVQPIQPPPDVPDSEISEEEAQQEEARRFARLLVSEIKLYNEEQVERGRESGDLYQRLQEDIDRSREMFEKRISAEVRARRDFFQDELVRILADGNPELLG